MLTYLETILQFSNITTISRCIIMFGISAIKNIKFYSKVMTTNGLCFKNHTLVNKMWILNYSKDLLHYIQSTKIENALKS